jgi:hypothetical protein
VNDDRVFSCTLATEGGEWGMDSTGGIWLEGTFFGKECKRIADVFCRSQTKVNVQDP